MSERAAYEAIPFDDDADEVKTWKGLALSAISDLRRYADDELPHRRMVSVEAYEADAVRLHAGAPQASEPAEAEAGKLADWILSYLENECALDPGCVAKSDRHNVANAVLNSVTGYMPHDLLRAGRELLDSPGIARIRVKSQGNDLLDRDEVFRRIIDGRLAAPLPHSAASTVEPVAYRWVLPGQHNWNVTIYHPRHHTTEQPSTIEPLYAAPTTLPNPVVADYATTETTDDDFLRNLIDWTHLYAFSGESWLSHKTADILIACARKKKATQQDAEALKVCPSIRPHAEHIGIDLIALARKECGPHE